MFVNSFLQIALGFAVVMFVAIFTGDGVYACVRGGFIVSPFCDDETTSHADIYSIPCKDCNKHYNGETQPNLEKRIYEHK